MPVQVANQQPNYFIGGLSPFSKLFKQLYFNFKCQSIDAPGDVNEFIRQCLKEFFTNSHISDALKNRNYILTPEEYPNLNQALRINVFDDCFDIFLRVYFKSMEEYLKNNTEEHKLIEIYQNEWRNFFHALVDMEIRLNGQFEDFIHEVTFLNEPTRNILLASLTKWKEFFFNDLKPSSNVPLAVRRLIKKIGEENAEQVFTDEIPASYKILGVYQPNKTMFNDAFTYPEFVRWHQSDFEDSLPSTSHANIRINQSQPSNEQSTINIELLTHEISRLPGGLSWSSNFLPQNQENFIDDFDQLQTSASMSQIASTSSQSKPTQTPSNKPKSNTIPELIQESASSSEIDIKSECRIETLPESLPRENQIDVPIVNVSIQSSDLPIEEQAQDELEPAPNNNVPIQAHNEPEQALANNLLNVIQNLPEILNQPAQRILPPFGREITENALPEFKLALQQQHDPTSPNL